MTLQSTILCKHAIFTPVVSLEQKLMKKPFHIALLLLLAACSGGGDAPTSAQEAPTFSSYIASLDKVTLPFRHHALKGGPQPLTKMDTTAFAAFKHAWSKAPVGIVMENDLFIVTMEYSMGDFGSVPLLISYNMKGKNIDFLAPYSNTGMDMGYQAVESLEITSNGKILVTDTVITWDMVEQGDDWVDGPKDTTVSVTTYTLEKRGEFVKLDESVISTSVKNDGLSQ